MKRIRIGKDINLNWKITVPEGMDSLENLNLTLQMRDSKGNKVDIEDFTIEDDTIKVGLRGTAFAYIGRYSFTLWVNKGELGQTLVDCIDAFQLVSTTGQEDEGCNCGCGCLDVSTVDLYGDLTFPVIVGPQGPQGIQGIQGPQGEPGQNGTNGTDGVDGFSPIATVTKSGNVATITITDKNGTTTANVYDGSGGGGGGSYTAGNGISIDANNEISVDTTVIASKTYVDNLVGDIYTILQSI